MGNTLKRVLATAPLAVVLAVVGVAGTAHAATSTTVHATKAAAEPSGMTPATSVAESAATITGVCSIYLYGLYFDGASFVTEATCRTFANLYANQYPPGSVTYTWFPLA